MLGEQCLYILSGKMMGMEIINTLGILPETDHLLKLDIKIPPSLVFWHLFVMSNDFQIVGLMDSYMVTPKSSRFRRLAQLLTLPVRHPRICPGHHRSQDFTKHFVRYHPNGYISHL